jgi:DNA-binding PadR family transcriptional regulator
MKGTYLGEFEELVLLTVCVLYDEAYGVAVMESIEQQAGRSASISAVHSALHRLEKKGFLDSQMGGATSERGGRRKRLFTITNDGKEALIEARHLREKLWRLIPDTMLPEGRP